MSNFLGGWFGYGLGRSVGKALFGEQGSAFTSRDPIPQMTEEDIRAEEKRIDEAARRLDQQERKPR